MVWLTSKLLLWFTLEYHIFSLTYAGLINWNEIMPKLCLSDSLKVVEKDGVTNVQVGIKIYDLYNIDEKNMEFGLRIGLLQIWKDSSFDLGKVSLPEPELAPSRVEECIWKPDVVFYNSKKAALYNVDTPSKFLKVLPGGYFYRYGMYRVVVSCQMDFHKYPLDVQRCPVLIASLGTPTSSQFLGWIPMPETGRSRPLKVQPITMANVKALQFSISPAAPYQYIDVGLSGSYSILQANLTFTRRITSSLVNSYLPSSLVVTLSWVSFWLDPNAVPGRVTLGVTSFLALATQVVHARSALPSLDYMTAMDIWLFGCILFVFTSLVEFTLANKLERNLQAAAKPVKASPHPTSQDVAVEDSNNRPVNFISINSKWNNKKKNRYPVPGCINRIPKKIQMMFGKAQSGSERKGFMVSDNLIDFYSRIIFPISSIVFSIAYWIFYMH